MGVLTFWPLGAWGQGSFLFLLYYDLLDWTSPVVFDSRTVRDSLCPLFFRKKADGKKRRGRDWEVFRAGDLAPDLSGASVHRPWADRAGATGHKVGALCRCWKVAGIPIFSLFLSDWLVPI